MAFGFLFILIVAVAIFIASEFLMVRSGKWDVLVQNYYTSETPESGWRGCRFLQMERQEGNTVRRTSYSWGQRDSPRISRCISSRRPLWGRAGTGRI